MVNLITDGLQKAGGYASQDIQKASTADYTGIFSAAVNQGRNFIISGFSFVKANSIYIVAGTVVALVALYAIRYFQPKPVIKLSQEAIEVDQKIGDLREAFQVENSRQFNLLKLDTVNSPKEWPVSADKVPYTLHSKLKEIDPSMVNDSIMITTIEDVPVLIAKVNVTHDNGTSPIETLFFFAQSKDMVNGNSDDKWLGSYISWIKSPLSKYEISSAGYLPPFNYDNIYNSQSIPKLLKGEVVKLALFNAEFIEIYRVASVKLNN